MNWFNSRLDIAKGRTGNWKIVHSKEKSQAKVYTKKTKIKNTKKNYYVQEFYG